MLVLGSCCLVLGLLRPTISHLWLGQRATFNPAILHWLLTGWLLIHTVGLNGMLGALLLAEVVMLTVV